MFIVRPRGLVGPFYGAAGLELDLHFLQRYWLYAFEWWVASRLLIQWQQLIDAF